MTTKKNPAFGYCKETAYKTCQAITNVSGSTKLRLLRNVSEDLNTNFQRDESNEVRGDAQSSGSVITGASAAGSIQLQYSLDTYDDLLVGMLYAASDAGTNRESGWRAGGYTPIANLMAAPGAITFNFAANKLTSAALFTVVPAAGTRIYVTGFGNRNLDTIFTVGSGTNDASNITLVNDTGEASISAYAGISANVTAAAGLVVPVKGYLRNGTFERSFQMVRMYSDVELAGTASTTGLTTVDWALFRGAIPTSIQLACAPGQAGWTGTMSVLAADEIVVEDAATAPALGGFTVTNWDQVLVTNSNPLANAIQSVVMVRLRKDGAAQTTAIRTDPLSFNINVASNAAEIAATRNRGAVAINLGTFTVTIAMSLLYIDATFHKAMLADSFYEVEIGVADSEGRCQLWRFPKARFTSERPSPGKNQPIAQNLSFIGEAGGDGGASSSSAGTGRMVEILSFYQRAA